MLFSCKITHSVISYLDRRGEDLETLNEKCDWPAEFLRDPSSWLEADKMELLLKMIQNEYGANSVSNSVAQEKSSEPIESLVIAAGHQCKDLRSWGALDSVLRMVQAPKDLFAQPERFLSYFISPAPPVGEIQRESESVSFVLPVSEVQFPLVTSYLRAALEALPTYIAKPMATVNWQNSRVTIRWSERQESLLTGRDEADLQLHPELVRNIFQNLEVSQKQLDELKRELIEKDGEIEKLRNELAKPTAQIARVDRPSARAAAALGAPDLAISEPIAEHISESVAQSVAQSLHDLYRLGDYIARGQQLITLLIGQGRQTAQVQEAMRRVDWEFVSLEGPRVVRKIAADLQTRSLRKSESSAAQDLTGNGKKVRATNRVPQKSFDGVVLNGSDANFS